MVAQTVERYIGESIEQTMKLSPNLCLVRGELDVPSTTRKLTNEALQRTFTDEDDAYDVSPILPIEELRERSVALLASAVPRFRTSYADLMNK